MYERETWPMTWLESMLKKTEMVRWMCGTSLREKKSSAEPRERIGMEAIGSVLKRNRLKWFGHVERKDKKDWARKCMCMEVEGARPRERPRKTWMEVVRNDMKASVDVLDCRA